jgi:hypothetical protein
MLMKKPNDENYEKKKAKNEGKKLPRGVGDDWVGDDGADHDIAT